MNPDIQGMSRKSAPISIVIPFLAFIIFCTVLHGAGMKLGSYALSAGGFVGVLLSCIAAFNFCYRKGHADGEMKNDIRVSGK